MCHNGKEKRPTGNTGSTAIWHLQSVPADSRQAQPDLQKLTCCSLGTAKICLLPPANDNSESANCDFLADNSDCVRGNDDFLSGDRGFQWESRGFRTGIGCIRSGSRDFQSGNASFPGAIDSTPTSAVEMAKVCLGWGESTDVSITLRFGRPCRDA